MKSAKPHPQEAQLRRRTWDVVIVGTGIGGATLGYALARAGKSVLFCEKGRSHLDRETLPNRYAEFSFSRMEAPSPKYREILAAAGRWWEPVVDESSAKPQSFVPFLGMGTGGSSAISGMAMERFFPEDFAPRQYFPNSPASSIPDRWPIDYADLKPHYLEAERLFGVHGEVDPLRGYHASGLRKAQGMCSSNLELRDFFAGKGLHPYRVPTAHRLDNCPGCHGVLSQCKHDAGERFLRPAIAEYGATLLDECEVMHIEAPGRRATGVYISHRGRTSFVRGHAVVVAAGALATPALLLSSTSDEWPNGLANESGLVGRNLMRHFMDIYLVEAGRRGTEPDLKELALNDFYRTEEGKLGTLQSFGAMPPGEVVAPELGSDLGKLHPGLEAAARSLNPLASRLIDRLFSRSVALASIAEDLPYPENRVGLSGSGGAGKRRISINYRLHPEEQTRVDTFRRLVREALDPRRHHLIRSAESNKRLAHACGTCRFGDDPTTSVLDRNNRAHGLNNLFVVDASFFPSSAGVNPSLTIAANALRVADHMI